jgi:hypothetical protein
MRPRGELRQAAERALLAGRATSREAAERTQVAYDAMRVALDNAVRAGDVVKVEPRRVPGVKRPVPVYALATASSSDAGLALATCWAEWPCTGPPRSRLSSKATGTNTAS